MGRLSTVCVGHTLGCGSLELFEVLHSLVPWMGRLGPGVTSRDLQPRSG